MSENIVVLGAGLVGGPIARELAQDSGFHVTVCDIRDEALQKLRRFNEITIRKTDVSKAEDLNKALQFADLVINAVPGALGFETLRRIISHKKNVVDIAFSAEDPFQLQELALANKITAVVDCGVAPGMSNMLAGFAHAQLERTEEVKIFVGGLPKVRTLPFEYKAVFSPRDVIEEYTRPARFMRDGKLVTLPALSEVEHLEFPQVGTLEAFNSDGLRSLLKTIDAPEMVEKTLRYPGHAEKMELLRHIGLFEQQALHIAGNEVRPIDLTSRLLFPHWQLGEGEVDVTVMRISVKGKKHNKTLTYLWELYDEYDAQSGVHSMARTTGYTAVVAAYLLLEKKFEQKGIIFPEIIGEREEHLRFILDGLKARGVVYRQSVIEAD